MNEDIKKEWVEALRSGQYQQGKRTLRTIGETYCCFGVLCDIMAKKGIGRWEPPSSNESRLIFNHAGITNTGYLPYTLREHLGITNTEEDQLVGLNDQGKSFDHIATVIETEM